MAWLSRGRLAQFPQLPQDNYTRAPEYLGPPILLTTPTPSQPLVPFPLTSQIRHLQVATSCVRPINLSAPNPILSVSSSFAYSIDGLQIYKTISEIC